MKIKEQLHRKPSPIVDIKNPDPVENQSNKQDYIAESSR